jgi:Retroviral aspartyl protease
LNGSTRAAWVQARLTQICCISRTNTLDIPLSFTSATKTAAEKVLLNSGATENFINPRMVEKLGLGSIDLQEPRTVFNVDGTENQDGKITSYCLLNILKGRKEAAQIFYITNLGEDRIILGYPWLWEFDPQINWKEGKVQGPPIKLSTTGRSWKLKWAA